MNLLTSSKNKFEKKRNVVYFKFQAHSKTYKTRRLIDFQHRNICMDIYIHTYIDRNVCMYVVLTMESFLIVNSMMFFKSCLF